MKKKELAGLALLGVSAGLLLTGCDNRPKTGPGNQGGAAGEGGANGKGKNAEQMSTDMQAFFSSLSPEAQKKFQQLDAQHKMMAVEMAGQSCNGKNKCKSMGGCATAEHACAGKNGCKGQGGTPVKDPNKAVDVQFNNQMAQRQKANGGMNGGSSAGSHEGHAQTEQSS